MRDLLLLTVTLHVQPGVGVVEYVAGKVGFYSFSSERTGEVKVCAYSHEIIHPFDGKPSSVTGNGILWMQ